MHRRDLCKWCTAQCAQRAVAIEIAIVANVKFLAGDRLAGRTDKSIIKFENLPGILKLDAFFLFRSSVSYRVRSLKFRYV